MAGYGAPVTSDPGILNHNTITGLTSYNPYDPANLSNAVSYPSTAWQYGTTAFGVHILTYPCHITSLPVAVTIECHAHRHKEVTL